MGDERHEKIQQRAYEIWEREGGIHGDHERHWQTAKDEMDREAALPLTADDALHLTADNALPETGEIASSDVLTVEALAMRTGITGDQAQDLIDRLGDDRAAIEEAARSLAVGQQNFSK
ncbi:DUF2934 domain-containing protein [Mesorhizobium sp. STM 4661]|uniref:DUF2934 domain-containing protein n=1 Tax=Mesorhizobium sp. STM 4661 TaxID=1297570 RepID=UPI0002C01D96|nr:DUF2934 domain-containing protein [Mesorhizobium sp. STM 4661]CCV13146.1 conserved hypothetical protein [Mesorhizobium sp. STM 4661]